jgi:ATP-dependent helicase/nuclease subunit B
MNNVRLLPAGRDLIDEIVAHLETSPSDLSDQMILFPGKRPGHYLRKRIATLIGHGYIPPAIYSMDDFIDTMYKTVGGSDDRKIDTIDATAILFDIHRTLENRIGGDNFTGPEIFLPIAGDIFTELEEFRIAGISAARLREAIARYPVERIQSLPSYYTRFYETVEQRGFSTRSTRYRAVADSLPDTDISGYRKIIAAGFYVLTGTEQEIFAELHRRENVLFLFQEGAGIEEHLHAIGMEFDRPEGSAPPIPAVRYHKCPDTHGQIFGLTGIVKKKLDNGTKFSERQVIVCPSPDTLFPLIQQTISLLEKDDYNISMGYPFSKSPLYGFFTALMDAITSRDGERYYAPDYLRFVLHPYTKNILIDGSAETTRILFHTIEEYLIERKSLTFFQLDTIESDATLFETIAVRVSDEERSYTADELRDHLHEIHNRTLRAFEAFGNVGSAARTCMETLSFIRKKSTAHRHPLFHHFSTNLMNALRDLTGSLLADTSFESTPGYFALLRHFFEEVSAPFPGTPLGGLQVLGFLETRNITFDSVYFLDANDDVLPAAKHDEYLVPTGLRKTLGLPTYKDRERLSEYYFDVLIRNAKEVDFFHIEKDKKEKSRFLEKMIWEEEKKKAHIDSSVVQYAIKLDNREPDPVRKTDRIVSQLKRLSYSATALDTYLTCPLQFYYSYVLNLSEKDEISDEIENIEIGSIVHEILRRYFIGRKGEMLGRETLPVEEMDRVIDEYFSELYGTEIGGPVYILKKQVTRKMREYIADYQIPMCERHRITVLDVETSLRIEKNGYTLRGRIDRIERRDDAIHILDYKISANDSYLRIRTDKLDIGDRESWYNAIGSLQLPVYTHLYATAFSTDIHVPQPAFLLLGQQSLGEESECGLYDHSESPADDAALLGKILFALLDEITDPATPFEPTDDPANTCPSCPYRTICGTQWTAV